MAKKGSTELGKAFEYACLTALSARYRSSQPVRVEDSPQLMAARKNFRQASEQDRSNLMQAAMAAVRVIERLEPRLPHPGGDSPLILLLQPDAAGQKGDVRDVLCIRRKGEWELGLSCKHNHHAVKHSRLSDTLDFGKKWLGIPCSEQYFSAIRPLFDELRQMREESRESGTPALWEDLGETAKMDRYYQPILDAFLAELRRLDEQCRDVPERLVRYLIGTHDFYKVITDDAHRCTRIEAANLSRTLNQPSGRHSPITQVPVLKMPTRFYSIDFKEDSKNTVIVACNHGWEISMRLHNASKRIEPSLKFDVQLESAPGTMYAETEPWDATVAEDKGWQAELVAEAQASYDE